MPGGRVSPRGTRAPRRGTRRCAAPRGDRRVHAAPGRPAAARRARRCHRVVHTAQQQHRQRRRSGLGRERLGREPLDEVEQIVRAVAGQAHHVHDHPGQRIDGGRSARDRGPSGREIDEREGLPHAEAAEHETPHRDTRVPGEVPREPGAQRVPDEIDLVRADRFGERVEHRGGRDGSEPGGVSVRRQVEDAARSVDEHRRPLALRPVLRAARGQAVQEHHGSFGGKGHDGPSSRDRPLTLSAAAPGTGRCSSRSRRCGRRPGT